MKQPGASRRAAPPRSAVLPRNRPVPDTRRRTGLLRAAGVLALLAAVAAGGCGKKGAPMPPLRVRPQAPQDLTLRQRGEKVVLMLRVPRRRTDGVAFGEDADLTLRLRRVQVDTGGGAKGRGARRRARRSAGAPAVSWVVPRAEWGRYRTGNRLEIPISVDSLELPEGGEGGTRAGTSIAFTAEVQEGRRQRSEATGPVTLDLCDPPPAPAEVEARLARSGVVLWWAGGDGGGSKVHVYRAVDDGPFPARPSRRLEGSESRFEDARAVPGQRLRYQVRFGSGEKPIACESAPGEASAVAADLFPPAPPEGFTAAAEERLIRLFWTPGSDPDLAGYLVYRSDGPEEPFRRLTPGPITETTYADGEVRSGVRYTYVVSAMDGASPPNESRWSAPAVEGLP